jgi:hypothetical protein
MLKLNVENVGNLVIECEGRSVRSESAFKLRDVVTSQGDAHTVVIELSEVRAIEGGGLGMLVIPAVVAESTKFAKFKRLSRPPLFVERVFVERNIFSYHLFDGKVFLHIAPRSCWLNA